ncbi:hypothetical protein PR048_010823 [Dryococelus australis]|uniref:Uncharacterized protein n=1 Tax=Dryococelus australis TaxID=614101 RepID=A0ABQ9I475_9NEOP|nr:hypothetical protein PR048_010823 [Dryococelus australis]
MFEMTRCPWVRGRQLFPSVAKTTGRRSHSPPRRKLKAMLSAITPTASDDDLIVQNTKLLYYCAHNLIRFKLCNQTLGRQFSNRFCIRLLDAMLLLVFAMRKGILGDLKFPPPLHSSAAPDSPRFTLMGSQDLFVKSRSNVSTTLETPRDARTLRVIPDMEHLRSRASAVEEQFRAYRHNALLCFTHNSPCTLNNRGHRGPAIVVRAITSHLGGTGLDSRRSHSRESCRTMPLVGGFSRVASVPPSLTFNCCFVSSLHPHGFSRPCFKSRPNLSTARLQSGDSKIMHTYNTANNYRLLFTVDFKSAQFVVSNLGYIQFGVVPDGICCLRQSCTRLAKKVRHITLHSNLLPKYLMKSTYLTLANLNYDCCYPEHDYSKFIILTTFDASLTRGDKEVFCTRHKTCSLQHACCAEIFRRGEKGGACLAVLPGRSTRVSYIVSEPPVSRPQPAVTSYRRAASFNMRLRRVTAGVLGRPSRPASHGERHLPPPSYRLLMTQGLIPWLVEVVPAYRGLSVRAPIATTGCPGFCSDVTKKKRKRRRMWVSNCLRKRTEQNAAVFLDELSSQPEEGRYQYFCRINADDSEHLLTLIEDTIRKDDT